MLSDSEILVSGLVSLTSLTFTALSGHLRGNICVLSSNLVLLLLLLLMI